VIKPVLKKTAKKKKRAGVPASYMDSETNSQFVIPFEATGDRFDNITSSSR
jgi:hypothetical protein